MEGRRKRERTRKGRTVALLDRERVALGEALGVRVALEVALPAAVVAVVVPVVEVCVMGRRSAVSEGR